MTNRLMVNNDGVVSISSMIVAYFNDTI